jgi:hypothetical protein
MTTIKVPVDPAQMFRLDGRIALVTGASSGLGERFARVLKAAGASVVLTARRHDRLAALSEELGNALWVAGDVTDDSHVYALVEKTAERHGRIDILDRLRRDQERHRQPYARPRGAVGDPRSEGQCDRSWIFSHRDDWDAEKSRPSHAHRAPNAHATSREYP